MKLSEKQHNTELKFRKECDIIMSREAKRKAIIDDGCNPEFVAGAKFDGLLEIPIIKKPGKLIIPSGLINFSERNKSTDFNEAVECYEFDRRFAELLIDPSPFIDELKKFKGGVISPDCSLYRDMPLAIQITNTYRNRAIGHYLQTQGLYVIPNVRWGDERTYTTKVLPEKIAFLGAEKHSIVSIGSYGCIKGKENEYYFRAGLEAMLETLEPEIVLVYGAMPDRVFRNYERYTHFHRYPDRISQKRGRRSV